MSSRMSAIGAFVFLFHVIVFGLGPVAQAQEVKIGMVQPLSGIPVIVDFGESYLQGNKLAIKEYNARGGYKGKPVQMIIYDDEGNPKRAVEVFTRLLTQTVSAPSTDVLVFSRPRSGSRRNVTLLTEKEERCGHIRVSV